MASPSAMAYGNPRNGRDRAQDERGAAARAAPTTSRRLLVKAEGYGQVTAGGWDGVLSSTQWIMPLVEPTTIPWLVPSW